MTRYVLYVTKNEADRYLKQSLESAFRWADQVYVYDDDSTDSTVWTAWSLGAKVFRRSEGVPSFMEHEGKFREDAWRTFVHDAQPAIGDVICVLDADEQLVVKEEPAWTPGAFEVRIREVFAVEDAMPWIREDGWWDLITGVRIVVWQEQGVSFPDRALGCGAVPYKVGPVTKAPGIEILHYGYAREEDRHTKFERYMGKPGHSAQHVASILRTPKLREWGEEQWTG